MRLSSPVFNLFLRNYISTKLAHFLRRYVHRVKNIYRLFSNLIRADASCQRFMQACAMRTRLYAWRTCVFFLSSIVCLPHISLLANPATLKFKLIYSFFIVLATIESFVSAEITHLSMMKVTIMTIIIIKDYNKKIMYYLRLNSL